MLNYIAHTRVNDFSIYILKLFQSYKLVTTLIRLVGGDRMPVNYIGTEFDWFPHYLMFNI